MTQPVKPIPDGYHSITPYLIIRDANSAVEYYKKVFGAVELMRMAGPDGKIGHAEIKIGDSPVMLADEHPDMGFQSPLSYNGTPVSILLYVPNVDETFARAVAKGGTVVKPLQDQFYGDRSGTVKDPFGHVWTVATHTEDVTPEEMNRRMEAFQKQQG